SSLLANSTRLGVFTENADLLKSPVNGIFEDPEVLSVGVYTNSGKALTMVSRAGRKITPDADTWDDNIRKILSNSSSFMHRRRDGHFTFWTRVTLKPAVTDEDPLYFNPEQTRSSEQNIGFVRVVLDSRPLRENLRALLLSSTLIGVFSLILGSLIAFLISSRITKPLNRLTDGVNSFGMGGRYREIKVETGDEIGKLALAFNNMVDSLRRREAEKEELEERLRHSQKMEAIGTLAGGVAHDFNNILMAINGYGILLQTELEKGGRLWTYADQIVRAGDRAATLTNRLLAFTRKQIIAPRQVIIDETISNIEKMLARMITEDVELKLSLGAPEAVVVVDPGQLDQVMINLVTNARDAMPKGGKITIATAQVALDDNFVKRHDQVKAGDYVMITVTDSGVGIPEHISKRIFDPFFTTKEVGKGTGLGLSMVYGIVSQHNGFIEVDSQEGKGSSFRLYLPSLEPVMQEKNAGSPVFLPGNRETILVAEDDAAVMGLLKGLLENNGYEVITAENGEDAIASFIRYQKRISLILLDVVMPKKNGKEVYAEISRIKPGIKTLFISGYTSDVIDWKGALQEGISLIAKPVQPDVLLAKMREALEG
ncbi:MAG TPA: ATP-binding protein, partial [Geobacteraceae bacterium]|nr:ATP-binding protein [Geobacteraceae bacterium]